jgi:hypothetical protein
MASPEELYDLLKLAIPSGARAAELMSNVPELVDAICENSYLHDVTAAQRAMYSADEIQAAAEALDDEMQRFLTILLGIRPGTYKRKVCDRYDMAGEVYGVSGRQARTQRYAGQLAA